MIYFFTPYSYEKNLGKAYNTYMQLLPNQDDWACLTDGDTCFLNNDFGTQMQACIDRYPDTHLFTAKTNRIGKKKQLHGGYFSEVADIKVHRRLAASLAKEHKDECAPITAPLSGFLLLVKKSVWEKVKFSEDKSLLGVDDDFTLRVQQAGYNLKIMLGMYVFHYYRLLEGSTNKKHLL